MKISAKIVGYLMVGGMLMSGIAGASEEVKMTTVKFQDLNLSSEAGVSILYRRIHSAAESVCPVYDARQLSAQAHQKKCVQGAEDDAIRRVNVDALTTYYQEKTGRSVPTMAASLAR